LARGRDVCESGRTLGLPLPCGRPVRAGLDVYVSKRRNSDAACRFFQRAGATTGVMPSEVITDRAPTYPRVLDQLWPAAWHHTEQYANNRVEADHAQRKRWLPRCAGSRPSPACGSWPPGTRSSKTYAADTTRSPPTSPRPTACHRVHRTSQSHLTASLAAQPTGTSCYRTMHQTPARSSAVAELRRRIGAAIPRCGGDSPVTDRV
jgi:hypothetical protein